MHAMLRGNAPREQRRATGRADRRGHEKVAKEHPLQRQAVQIRGANLWVPIAACSPWSLIIGQNEHDIRPLGHTLSPTSWLGLPALVDMLASLRQKRKSVRRAKPKVTHWPAIENMSCF